MGSTSETLSRFVGSVGDTIIVTFKAIDDFIDSVVTFFITSGFWISVLFYFILIILLLSAPLFILKYWESIVENYSNIMDRVLAGLGSSNKKKKLVNR